MRSGLFVVLVVTVVSCVQSGVTVCGERVCPSGTVCDSVHGLCVTQEQLDVCETVEDGMACSLSPVSEGECNGGVCIEQVCGDGLVTGAEDCEGETETGKDCTYLDYYDPVPLKCTKRCVFDEAACTGSCGDGMVNGPAGREVCDGAPPDATSCLDYGFEGGRLDCGSLCAPAFEDCFDVGFVPFVSTVGEHVISIAQPEAGHVFLGQDQSLIHIANGVSTRTPSTYITGIWGSSASDVFAVGNAGTAYHYDGSQWTSINTGVSTDLYSVWGSGPNDVYVVGASLTMRHFNGTQWSAVPGPTDIFAFRGIHGIDANNVVAVAGDGWMRQLRDGVWSTVDTSACNDVSGKPYFDAVWMFDADHIVAVGSVGLICVRDGGVWRRIKSGTTRSLRGVSGRAWNDIFVVGDLGTVLHYDGENWWPLDAETGIDLQDVNADRDVLLGGVFGFARKFAGGAYTNPNTPASGTLKRAKETGELYFYAGQQIWKREDAIWTLLASSDNDFGAMWVGPTGEVFVEETGIQRWNGTGWTALPSSVSFVTTFVGASAQDLYAIGYDGTIEHFDGNTWSAAGAIGATPVAAAYGANTLLVVGYDTTLQEPRMFRRNGSSWVPMTLPPGIGALNAVYVAADNDAYAVGRGGNILHWDGTAWTIVWTNGGTNWTAVDGTSGTDIVVGGGGGLALHYDGKAWSPLQMNGDSGIWHLIVTPKLVLATVGQGTAGMLRSTLW